MDKNVRSPEEPIPFAGTFLGQHRHVCAFFDNADDEYHLLLPFIKDGFTQGDRAYHITDPAKREEHLQRLRGGGIDVDAAQRRDQLDVVTWDQAYLREGHFDQDAMLALIEEVLQNNRGFRLTRLVAHMEWALEDRPGVDDLVEYETRLNYVLPRYKDPVI